VESFYSGASQENLVKTENLKMKKNKEGVENSFSAMVGDFCQASSKKKRING